MFAVHRGMVDGIHISAVGIYYRGSVYDSVEVLGRVEFPTGMITQPYYDPHKGVAIYGLYAGDGHSYIGYIRGIGGRKKTKTVITGDLWGTNEDRWEFIPTQDGMTVFLNGSHQGRYTREDIQTLIYRKYNVFEML